MRERSHPAPAYLETDVWDSTGLEWLFGFGSESSHPQVLLLLLLCFETKIPITHKSGLSGLQL